MRLSHGLQAPKEQKSKEAKAIAAANSSKGKKKVSRLVARPACPTAQLLAAGKDVMPESPPRILAC